MKKENIIYKESEGGAQGSSGKIIDDTQMAGENYSDNAVLKFTLDPLAFSSRLQILVDKHNVPTASSLCYLACGVGDSPCSDKNYELAEDHVVLAPVQPPIQVK